MKHCEASIITTGDWPDKLCGLPAKFTLTYIILGIDADSIAASKTWYICYKCSKRWKDIPSGYHLSTLDPKLMVMT